MKPNTSALVVFPHHKVSALCGSYCSDSSSIGLIYIKSDVDYTSFQALLDGLIHRVNYYNPHDSIQPLWINLVEVEEEEEGVGEGELKHGMVLT